jgi:VanZ family protein
MSNSRRGLWFWVWAWWPVAVGITAIAVESTKYFGADRTSGPLRVMLEALFGRIGDARWATIHHYIRKSGHFLGYGALGLAWLRAWWLSLPRYRFLFDAELALAGTALVASLDEWHQTFLPNRTGPLGTSCWIAVVHCSCSGSHLCICGCAGPVSYVTGIDKLFWLGRSAFSHIHGE